MIRWLWHFIIWGAGYQFLSGPVIVAGIWHHLNCHEPGCPRIVKHHKTHCSKHEKTL